ncbi:hypothetical protein Tco_0004832 [Tanacetum coccineum]
MLYMEALEADEDALDKEVADQGRSTKKRRSDSAASGSAKPPPKDDDQSSQKPRESDASASDPESEHSEQSSDDLSKQDERNDSDMEDTDNAHIPKVSTTTWFKPIPESERPATPEPEWTIPRSQNITGQMHTPQHINFHKNSSFFYIIWMNANNIADNNVHGVNPEGHQILRNNNETTALRRSPGVMIKKRRIHLTISKLKAARYLDFGLEELVPSLWVESEREYDISAVYASHLGWFRRRNSINKHSESSDREAVRSHMRILSVFEYNKARRQEVVPEDDKKKKHRTSVTAREKTTYQNNYRSLESLCWSEEDIESMERRWKGVKASANSDVQVFITSAQDGEPITKKDVRLCLAMISR